MHSKFKYFIIVFTFVAIVFITTPTKVNAAALSGTAYFYSQYGVIPNGIPTGFDSGLNDNCTLNSTSSYCLLPGATPSTYTFYGVKQIGVVNTNYSYKAQTSYIARLDFYSSGGNVLRNYSSWNVAQDNVIACDSNATCGITWEQNNGYFTAVISYYSTTAHTGSLFDLGSVNNANKVVFVNTGTANSNITIRAATITEVNQGDQETINAINNQTQSIINNQNQNTQNIINNINDNNQKLEDINNTLTDDNITADADADFFDNINLFEDNTLSGIITAPLTYLRSIDGTCSPITLTYKSATITLPCGDTIFWGRNDVSTFRTFWNILFGGYLIYRLCFKLFKTINDALDPTKDDIGGVAV